MKAADLHIIRKEVGIEYVGTVMGAEVGHEIASEVLAEAWTHSGTSLSSNSVTKSLATVEKDHLRDIRKMALDNYIG